MLVVSIRALARTRAVVELRRGTRRLQRKSIALKTGRNVVRIRLSRSLKPGRYVLVVRAGRGDTLSHRLRLR